MSLGSLICSLRILMKRLEKVTIGVEGQNTETIHLQKDLRCSARGHLCLLPGLCLSKA